MRRRNYTLIMAVIYMILGSVIGIVSYLTGHLWLEPDEELNSKLFVFEVFGGVFVGLLNFIFFKLILSYLVNKMVNVLSKVKEGDYSARLNLRADDLVGKMAEQFDETIDALEKSEYNVYHDSLTKVGNRLALYQYYDEVIRLNKSDRHFFLFFDVNQFKKINDTYGHQTGDDVLKEIGRRLNRMLLPNEKGFRISGDEFLVVATLRQDEKICLYKSKLQSLFTDTLLIDENEIDLTVSIGYSELNVDGNELYSVIDKADKAMYLAKKAYKQKTQQKTEGNKKIPELKKEQKIFQFRNNGGNRYEH